ncbi:MAG: inositol monophosphatase family protein [Gemmatimonadaceae bacterium]|nr:inositol monophosphatase family protein [Gemmatimonadaceae bacterium]
MTTVPQRVLLDAVRDVAQMAARVAMAQYRTALTVELKGDGSPVTVADRAAETAAREWITARFPTDGIVGEEFGDTRPDAARRWFVDPIDGTKSFVRGVPLWGTLIGVVEGDHVLAGAVCCPAADELVCAALGEGAYWNDQRCAVSRIDTLAEATVLVTDERAYGDVAKRDGWRALSAAASIARSWGDCYGYVLVATGRAEVMVDPKMNPWDAAAVLPIVEEAGGVFTDYAGHRTAFGGDVIATNFALRVDARRALNAGAPQ